ncbi:uncharacterized protein N7482_005294 [Penicillium canariense]|uniref:Uncharacterized protein n=1 Tax=Penicillium canariense TaxID=189055 RepID=A0A9W9I4G5_9EURO|nr:uncharacterized protein N7482_005294 [Penicillium canariense]KAJ5166513.1 hypothetical protein N7482_005294 [Penicillium canariense]
MATQLAPRLVTSEDTGFGRNLSAPEGRTDGAVTSVDIEALGVRGSSTPHGLCALYYRTRSLLILIAYPPYPPYPPFLFLFLFLFLLPLPLRPSRARFPMNPIRQLSPSRGNGSRLGNCRRTRNAREPSQDSPTIGKRRDARPFHGKRHHRDLSKVGPLRSASTPTSSFRLRLQTNLPARRATRQSPSADQCLSYNTRRRILFFPAFPVTWTLSFRVKIAFSFSSKDQGRAIPAPPQSKYLLDYMDASVLLQHRRAHRFPFRCPSDIRST